MKKLITGILVVLALTVMASLFLHDYFRLTSIKIFIRSGSTKLGATIKEKKNSQFFLEGVRKNILEQLEEFKNQPLWSLSLQEVSKKILNKKFIEQVSLRRSFPNELQVTVTIAAPPLLWFGSNGQLSPINHSGELLEPLSEVQYIEAPILKGDIFKNSKEKRLEVLKILKALPQKGEFSRDKISEILLVKNKDYKFYLKNTQTLVLLSSELEPNKPNQVERVLEYLNSHQLKGRVIDGRLSKKVVVKLRNAP